MKMFRTTNRNIFCIFTTFRGIPAERSSPVSRPLPNASQNRKLELLNINGVFYKSTKTKLQKQDATNKRATSTVAVRLPAIKRTRTTSRTLFVRGDKFVLNPNGNQLTRISTTVLSPSPAMKRIDIGGLTYRITNTSADTYERTDTHRTRFYLTTTKQKSIRQLAQNLVKSNVPCAIFQKLGKCHGRERGRCPKVHDIRNVAICQKLTQCSYN